MSAATSASRSAWRSQIATVAPHRANRRAVARPIPWAAPVTTAIRSVSRMESASKRSPVVIRPLCHARPSPRPPTLWLTYVTSSGDDVSQRVGERTMRGEGDGGRLGR